MKILKKSAIPLFCIILCLSVSIYFYAIDKGAVLTNANHTLQKTVIIDAGHGGLTNTTH